MNSTVQRIIAAEYSPFQEGTFIYDELLEHLKCFNAFKVVSLGEYSTHVVLRVQYDSETNKLVGFVLPCGVPAFCLACIDTDNKFDAELVIKHWHYIHNELNQRGITLISIGADGDSRELRAMQVSTQLLSSTQSTLSSLSSMSNRITIPYEWKKWFVMKRPGNSVHSRHGTCSCKAQNKISPTIYHFTIWKLFS